MFENKDIQTTCAFESNNKLQVEVNLEKCGQFYCFHCLRIKIFRQGTKEVPISIISQFCPHVFMHSEMYPLKTQTPKKPKNYLKPLQKLHHNNDIILTNII